MIRSSFLVAAALLSAQAALAQGLPPSPGNLIVLRVGDGAATLTSAAAPIFFDEYTPAGTLVQSIPVPADAASQPVGQYRCTIRGSAASHGRLTRSTNGIYFTAVGFDADAGTPRTNYEQVAANVVPRVVALLDITGNVNTSTGLTDAYDAAEIRSAVTDDGINLWTAGSSGGVRYATYGATTSTLVTGGNPTNLRCVDIFHGDVYASTGSSGGVGLIQVDTGLPTGSGVPQAYLPGFPNSNAGSSYDFYFANPHTVYVADDGSLDPGIQKYELIGGVWTWQYTLGIVGQVARGLSGYTQNGVTTLWATSQVGFSSGNGNDLIMVVDTGAGSTANVLTSAAPGSMFRGVRYYDVPTSLQRLNGLACGSADIKASGSGQIGTDVFLDVTHPVGFPLIYLGTTNLSAPLCSCTVLTDLGLLTSSGSFTLQIPNDTALVGATVYAQGIDVFDPAAASCPILSFATVTDGYAITMQ
ncbi:MAG: hypothetical protein H6835_06865 [Planctomycetes bacterium]|nr:hypothetical protein [Planctomycetota bacterium]